jgi:hypothetical protein
MSLSGSADPQKSNVQKSNAQKNGPSTDGLIDLIATMLDQPLTNELRSIIAKLLPSNPSIQDIEEASPIKICFYGISTRIIFIKFTKG